MAKDEATSTRKAGTIVVGGTGRVAVDPDVADLQLGVSIARPTVDAARSDAATAMTSILAAVRASGVADRDIRTTLVSVQPRQVGRGKKTAMKLVLPKKVRKLAAAALARHACPLAAIRVVAANSGGYRISASRTVRLAPRARDCR